MNILILAFTLLLSVWITSAQNATDPDIEMTLLSANQFAAELFAEASGEKKENLIISAPSVHYLLTLMTLGAQGDTLVEVDRSLHLSNNPSSILRGYKHILKNAIKSTNSSTLHMANRIYVKNGMIIREDFKNKIAVLGDDAFDKLDDDTAKSTEKINSWIDTVTDHKVSKFLKDGELSPSTKFYFVNAVYFKSEWKYKFEHTALEPFYFQNQFASDVNTMLIHAELEYSDINDLGATFVKLPYKVENLFMLICMPTEGSLDVKICGSSDIEYEKRDIVLRLPKFKVESEIDLKPILNKLGLFQKDVNFTGISMEEVFVNDARQKAYVSVNEEGSEAWAITDLIGRSGPTDIKINKPFYYAIVSSGLTLFQGQIYSPEY